MFGIGGGELLFIAFIVLMLFGSDKIPGIARTLGKTIAQVKNVTNDLKQEIQKGAEESGIDTKAIAELRGGVKGQIDKLGNELTSDIINTVDQVKEDIEDATGPIKRQM
jgi:sec-independent protein translocase protein TatA